MSKHGFTIAVIKGTNRIVATSDVDWTAIRPGSYFRVAKEDIFYTVAKTSQIYYIKDFVTSETLPTRIRIASDTGINILRGDELTISYKENELLTVIDIAAPGDNYKVGDVITLLGGVPSVNKENNYAEKTTFRVEEVNETGGITRFSLISKGKYFESPANLAEVAGGEGEGAVFEVQFKVTDNRVLIERFVENVIFDNGNTVLDLNYPMPKNVNQGKLSINKWEITLKENYLGETKINEIYEISRDFTPVLDLPLMTKGSFSVESIYNQSMKLLEAKIVELEKKITQLEQNDERRDSPIPK